MYWYQYATHSTCSFTTKRHTIDCILGSSVHNTQQSSFYTRPFTVKAVYYLPLIWLQLVLCYRLNASPPTFYKQPMTSRLNSGSPSYNIIPTNKQIGFPASWGLGGVSRFFFSMKSTWTKYHSDPTMSRYTDRKFTIYHSFIIIIISNWTLSSNIPRCV